LDETATGALIGERGGDGQAGQEEQGEEDEFGFHSGVVHKPFRRGTGKSLADFRIFFEKKARAEAGGTRRERARQGGI